ncbi:hypothetical protein Leryth_016686 [Lithospermum erythrorhizon]|nr:hypothetical protein Leryth_016686 [Lithospermum erythrorhizon]
MLVHSTVPVEAVFAEEMKKLQAEQFKPMKQVTLEPFKQTCTGEAKDCCLRWRCFPSRCFAIFPRSV